jgi:prolyl-tRNA editing enzyme YbaK/EbsC (Cys-tRNA(Pro) deacylase)
MTERGTTSLLELGIAAGTIEAEIVLLDVPTPTVQTAAEALAVDESQILKSLLFVSGDGRVFLAIASGTARINRDRLAAIVGAERVRLAPPELVLERTGYPAGGVAPVAHATPIPVVIDRNVLELPVAYAGGGTEAALLRISPQEIIRLTGPLIADLTG